MCHSSSRYLLAVLLLPFVAAAEQKDGGIAKCLAKGGGASCIEKVAEDVLENAVIPDKLEVLPGVSLIRSNRTARGMDDLSNRTISLDIDALGGPKRDGRSRRRRIYALIMTAIIAAKASAVATAASLMIPLALVGISLVAAKALIVGKLSVILAIIFIASKYYQSTQGQKSTEIIYDDHHGHQERLDEAMMQAYPIKKRKEFAQQGMQPYQVQRRRL